MPAFSGLGGSISPSGTVPVGSGYDMAFNILPDIGNYLKQVYVDGFPIGNVSSYLFSNVQSSHNTFSK
jgi:hypothetical protein